jgi:hypothetical protein
METGYVIEEGGIISRVAEGAITFADDDAQYAPVIAGTAADQVAQATAAAATVLGFVKKPLYGTIVDGDMVSVVTRGIITMNIVGTVAENDLLQVDADVDALDELTLTAAPTIAATDAVDAATSYALANEIKADLNAWDATTELLPRVARVLEGIAGGVAPGKPAWIEIRIGA